MNFRDHPRLRGEHSTVVLSIHFNYGSPPPTRGTLKNVGTDGNEHGITPAYAGNTGFSPVIVATKADHPRLRGEHTKKSAKIKALYFCLP